MLAGMKTLVAGAVWSALVLGGCDCDKGCSSDRSTENQSGGVHTASKPSEAASLPKVQMKPEWTTCVADNDCVHVPVDCCGCAGGGADVAIHWKNLEAVAAARSGQCAGVACAMMVGNDVSCSRDARCVAGTCQLVGKAGAPKPSTAEGAPKFPLPAEQMVSEDILKGMKALQNAKAAQQQQQQQSQPPK